MHPKQEKQITQQETPRHPVWALETTGYYHTCKYLSSPIQIINSCNLYLRIIQHTGNTLDFSPQRQPMHNVHTHINQEDSPRWYWLREQRNKCHSKEPVIFPPQGLSRHHPTHSSHHLCRYSASGKYQDITLVEQAKSNQTRRWWDLNTNAHLQ